MRRERAQILVCLACALLASGCSDAVLVERGGDASVAPDGGSSAPAADAGEPVDAARSSDAAASSDASMPAPTPTPRERVLAFLRSQEGSRTLSGIHNRFNPSPGQYTGQIHEATGVYPALWSGDFLFEPYQIEARPRMIEQAQIEWSHGAVVNLMYHACPPTQDEACNWEGGILSHLDDAQWRDVIAEDGRLHAIWLERLDRIAPYLRALLDQGIAPLFRPLHEMNQGLFWWGGRPGPEGTRRLFQITHDHLVEEHGLTGMIWVWDVQDLSWDFADYDPGEAYSDIVALDVYGDGFTSEKYDAIARVAGGRLMAIGECARLPTPEELDSQPRWSFFMSWSELTFSDNAPDAITTLYRAPRVLTLDEMPGW